MKGDMSKNSEYVARMEAKLRQWDKDFDAFVAVGERAGDEARTGIRDLRASRDAARSFIDRIRFAGESAGAQMHASMESAWEVMRKSLEKASSELRK